MIVDGFPVPIGTGFKAGRWLVSNWKIASWSKIKYRAAAAALAREYQGGEHLAKIFDRAVTEAAEIKPRLADKAKTAAVEAVFPGVVTSERFKRDLARFSVNFAVRARTLAEDRGHQTEDITWTTEALAAAFQRRFVDVVLRSDDTGVDARLNERVLEELGLSGAERGQGLLRVLTVAGSSTVGTVATELGHHSPGVSALVGAGAAVATTGGVIATAHWFDGRRERLELIQRLVGLAVALIAPRWPTPIDRLIRRFEKAPADFADWLADRISGLRQAEGARQMINAPPAEVPWTFQQIAALQQAYNDFDRVVEALQLQTWAEFSQLDQAVLLILDHCADDYGKPTWTGPRASTTTYVEAVDICILLARSLAAEPSEATPEPVQPPQYPRAA